MDFHRMILLLLLVVAGVTGQPQWQRQSTLSSPLSMGMRFLDNIRSGMTRTIGRIFGNGPQQGKEVNQIRPVRQHLPHPPSVPPPPAAPPAHVHIGTEAPSSFFTVLHEAGPSTPFPDTHGFTDESFKPSDFFTGNSPFQGNVEEENLSFQNNEVSSPQVSGGKGPPGPSFAVFQEGESLPAQGEVFQSSFPHHPAFDGVDTSIPFGNVNHFTLGQSFRQEPGDFPVGPKPTISADLLVREEQPNHELRPAKPESQSHQHVFLASRADRRQEKVKPFTVLKAKSSSPVPSSITTPPHFSTSSRPTTSVQTSSHPSSKPPREYTTFQVIQEDTPLTRENTAATVSSTVTKEPSFLRKPSGHISTGTKIRISPKSDSDVEETEVSSYEFGYGVLDNDSGNQYFHAEKREEGLTKGSYKIQLADGRVQTVTYLADSKGFHPQITYEGEARYPDDKEHEDTS
ncbi:uncharacterized protein [Macrobrachium rosenbergii]|uniref:uncharacterized protein n=1 Tax=Macrobrachium rosenbergii TaxID=79674 RepID=UPI0034D6FC62